MNATRVNVGAGRPGRRAMKTMLLSLAIAASAGVAATAWALPHGGERGHGGMAGGMMFHGSPERVGRMVDHMLDGLNATDAQRSTIKQIAQSAAADLKSQRETGRALRERSMQILTAPTVDANAAEAVRQQMMAQHDQASRRMTQALVDVSRVLTPEQRAKVAERVKERSVRMQERQQRMERDRPQR